MEEDTPTAKKVFTRGTTSSVPTKDSDENSAPALTEAADAAAVFPEAQTQDRRTGKRDCPKAQTSSTADFSEEDVSKTGKNAVAAVPKTATVQRVFISASFRSRQIAPRI